MSDDDPAPLSDFVEAAANGLLNECEPPNWRNNTLSRQISRVAERLRSAGCELAAVVVEVLKRRQPDA